MRTVRGAILSQVSRRDPSKSSSPRAAAVGDTAVGEATAGAGARNDDAGARHARRYGRLVVGVATSANLLVAADVTAIETILPRLASVLGVSLPQSVSLVSLYFVAVSSALPLVMALGDRLSKHRLFAGGVWLVGVSAVVCASANSLLMLALGRLLLGVAAALTTSVAAALVSEAFEPRARARPFGAVAVGIAAGFLIGPTLGGVMFDLVGWRSSFLLYLPASIAVGLGAYACQRRAPPPAKGFRPAPERFDYAGASCLIAFMLAASVLVQGLFQAWHINVALCGVLALAALGLRAASMKRRAPALDLKIFEEHRAFLPVVMLGLLSFTGAQMLALAAPAFATHVFALSADRLGLLMAAFPVGFILGSSAGTWLSRRFGEFRATLVAQAAIFAGALLLITLDARSRLGAVAMLWLLVGLGRGLFVVPYNTLAMGMLRSNRLGAGAGILELSRNFGMMMGASLAGAMYAAVLDKNAVVGAEFLPAVVRAARLVFGGSALFAVSSLAIVSVLAIRPAGGIARA